MKWIGLLVIAAVAVAVVLNRQWIYDFYRGAIYQPASEMAAIRDSLSLTDRGTFLFNAAQPALNSQDEFNSNCRSGEDEMVAVLGCYREGNIYIYDIRAEELEGIRELTAAHELLHAVYARMSEQEKADLAPELEKVYENNKEILESDLATYDENERAEELYVRAGTEVKNLPDKLEKHYAQIFKDQNLVVDFYDSYIAEFREIEAELDDLAAEMEELSIAIENKTAEYEKRVGQLNADIVSFNSCAAVAGCFKGQDEFNTRRNTLIRTQEDLAELYEGINGLIEQYNAKVEIYNADVLRSEELNQIINSSSKPNEI